MTAIFDFDWKTMRLKHLVAFFLVLPAAGCACLERAPRAAAAAESPPAGRPVEPAAHLPEIRAEKPVTAAPDQPKSAGKAAAEAKRPAGDAPASAPAGRDTAEPAMDPASTVAATSVAVNEAPAVKPASPAIVADMPAVDRDAPAVKPATPVAKAEPKPQPKAVAIEEKAPKKETAAKPAPPSLDLTALERQLKETRAIGVFTKLTLKNQVDDLLARFRGYYDGRSKTTLAQLRQSYESLILKVVSLLQDGDPSLARMIVDSREAIWGILSDRDSFLKL